MFIKREVLILIVDGRILNSFRDLRDLRSVYMRESERLVTTKINIEGYRYFRKKPFCNILLLACDFMCVQSNC